MHRFNDVLEIFLTIGFINTLALNFAHFEFSFCNAVLEMYYFISFLPQNANMKWRYNTDFLVSTWLTENDPDFEYA